MKPENEVTNVPDQKEEEEKSGEGETFQAQEGENAAACLVLNPDQMQEHTEKGAEFQFTESKNNAGRVQSVFARVRSQLRGQSGCEVSKMGMLQLVQHVTRQLDKNKVEQGGSEDNSPNKEVEEDMDTDFENDQDSKVDECVFLLQQILNSIDGLRKEVGEELKLLRQIRELETQSAHSLHTNCSTGIHISVPPLPGAPRRRILRRTLTTVAPKNTAAPATRLRGMSELVVSSRRETASNGSNGRTLPTSRLKPLLPSIVVTQQAKKPVCSLKSKN